MFHIHFHFEESYAAWIQAIAAIVGIYFLILNFRQANKNIELQMMTQRTANKPILVITPPNINDVNWHPKHRVSYHLEILKNDAFEMCIFTDDNHYELFDHDDLVLKIYYPQMKVNEILPFSYD